ncbi:unnamed protein product [Rotaria magnacalcarata]|uniref:Uncharacterized protein n=1 Tax=Rotaria magnacalcarata TaxID=392030 RepID=A0A816P028_9BILA|nr:unnamed protein product [Rotaria magnacalcarata]
MQIIIHVCFILSLVQAQNWKGTYYPSSICNTTQCCCLYGPTNIINSSNVLLLSTSLNGLFCDNSPLLEVVIQTSGFTGNVFINLSKVPIVLNFNLSSDSNTITAANPYLPKCPIQATRNVTAISSSSNKYNFGIPHKIELFILSLSLILGTG